MTTNRDNRYGRRRFLASAVASPLMIAASGLSTRGALAATPACDDGVTPRQTAGPFFKPESPQRASLIDADMRGERLSLSGRILSTACEPLAGALIDIWHCDANGAYDNRGYRFRGHQFADEAGRFRIDTLKPGEYPGRTRHIHVNVQAPGSRVLTTQLYFPGETLNEKDFLFDPRLLMRMRRNGDNLQGRFDFVLRVA